MDVSKSDCGGIAGAGEYEFRDGYLIVTPHQIGIWATNPEAIFTAVASSLSSALRLYVLTSWRLPIRGYGTADAVSDAGMSPR